MEDEVQELELRHYAGIIRRRLAVVLLVPTLAVGAVLALAFNSTRIYEASADVLISDPQSDSIFTQNAAARPDPVRNVETQIEVMQSRPIEQAVDRELGAAADKVKDVSVLGVGNTDLIRVSVQSASTRLARRAANAYAATFVETRQKQSVEQLLAAGTELQTKLTELQLQIDGTAESAQRDALVAQFDLFKQKLDQVQVDASLRRGGAQVVARAALPTTPVKPKPVRDGALAAVLGLLLGIGLAFTVEYFDDKVRTAEDVARHGEGLIVLTEVPSVPGWRDRKSTRVVALEDPASAAAEAYRSLRTSVQVLELRQPLKSLLVTSPQASEGKTTTVVNLGVSMARSGRRVIIVDLDLRRPRLGQFFDLEGAFGFTSVLVGDAPLSHALVSIDVAPGTPPLQVLPAGAVPPNPSEVLGAPRVAELLVSLQSVADLVIIDSPPLVPVTDALVLSSRVDGVLLVVAAETTRRRHLARAVELLRQTEAPLIGAVLNSTSRERRGYGYQAPYGSGYVPIEANTGPRRRAPTRRT